VKPLRLGASGAERWCALGALGRGRSDPRLHRMLAARLTAGFDAAAAKLLDTFAQRFQITFQPFDVSDVHGFAELQARASDLGWDSVPGTRGRPAPQLHP
jgi:hypothetical protein